MGLGVAWSLITPAAYTAETRLAVGEQSLAAVQVPGYVSATRSLASDYARYVQDGPEYRETLPNSGRGVASISASPIPETSIIRVEVEADEAATAAEASNAVGRGLVEQVASARPDIDEAQSQFAAAYSAHQTAEGAAGIAGAELASAESRGGTNPSALAALRSEVQRLVVEAATLDLQQQALGAVYRDAYSNAATSPTLTVVAEAASASSDRASRLQRDVIVGLVLGGAAAWGFLYWRKHWRGRGKSSSRRHSASASSEGEAAP